MVVAMEDEFGAMRGDDALERVCILQQLVRLRLARRRMMNEDHAEEVLVCHRDEQLRELRKLRGSQSAGGEAPGRRQCGTKTDQGQRPARTQIGKRAAVVAA